MQRRQVQVDELQFGMYVAELDRPWTDTPFAFQGFHLRNDEQLATLKKFCKHVFVDQERDESAQARPATPKFKIHGSTPYEEKTSVEGEFPSARQAYQESLVSVETLLRPMAQPGGVLDTQALKYSITRLTDSVVRNPDALLLFSQLREKSEAAHARALQVGIYMIVFGRFLKLAREELELLGLLGLLQDIGKLRLPASVTEKKGPLTSEELEVARSHVEHSVAILRATPGLPPRLPDLAALHHERQDGSGYPCGLQGAQIGLHGAIAAIADTFDALTAPRLYAEPLSPSSALSYLYKERGSGFHPELVEQFIQCVGVFPVGSVVELNSGEIGLVITQNLVRRLKPRVMVVLDPQGHPVRPHKIMDLDRDPLLRPDEPYKIRRSLDHSRVQVDPKELFL
jgi:HD-GYP domain-containing protein (c-di-GMP phosphodiesterase class II)